MKKVCFTMVILFIGLISFAQTATAPSGSGTSVDPYQVATLNNLYWITQNSSSWAAGKYFVQTANIDAATSSGWASGQGLSPIGNSTTKFQGNYNGGGFTINGVFCNRSSINYQALFGYVNLSATISNLGVTNVNITGRNYIGGLVGYIDGGTISKCYSTGSVSNNTTNSSSQGGLVGITFTPGPVLIKECNSTVNVTGGGYNLGGFVGGNWASSTNSIIQDCFSTGNVTMIAGSSDVGTGAFCGLNNGGKIVRCYTIGNVYYTGATAPSSKGFIGVTRTDNGTPVTADNYWDKEVSNQTGNTIGATGKITADMKTQSTFTNWDFNIWGLSATVNSGYPNLGGMGTMPLTWQGFNATEQNNSARLFWSTTSENNTADFTIEHSTNGVLWNNIGSIAAAGNSKQVQNYSFVHINPSKGNNYYRILQSDLDGHTSYSKIVALDFLNRNTVLVAYPNPVINGNLNLVLPSDGFVSIYDANGKVLIKQYLNAGNQTLNLTNFSPGVYQVKSEKDQISILVK